MVDSMLRTVMVYAIVTFGLRLMGKRQVGELQSAELVITMLISELAALPLQSTGEPLLSGIIPIFTLVACELLLSFWMMKNRKLRRILCGRPTVLIHDGRLNQQEMARVRCTVEDLSEALRLQGIFDLDEVSFAALEPNGKLSVLLKAGKQPPKAEDMGLNVQNELFVVMMEDGCICERSAVFLRHAEDWVQRILLQEHCAPQEVFLLAVSKDKKYRLVRKAQKGGSDVQTKKGAL